MWLILLSHMPALFMTSLTDTMAQNGSTRSQAPATFKNIIFLTTSKRNQVKAAVSSVA